MTPTQRQYFDNMQPGETLTVSQARNPADLITAGKDYIDAGGMLTFSDDYSTLTKCNPIPTTDAIRILVNYTI